MSFPNSACRLLKAHSRLSRTRPIIPINPSPRPLSTLATSCSPLASYTRTSSRAQPCNIPFGPLLSQKPVANPRSQKRHNSYHLSDAVGHKKLKDFDIEDGIYIVTGGGRGLGLCMAEALAEAGGKG